MVAMIAAMALAPETMRLWTGDAPGALGHEDKDIPILTVYRPEHPSTTAIVVCPGGGYMGLADHEGKDYALWLNRYGITAYVLRYRLSTGGYHHPSMLQDVSRAVRTVRFKAADWGLKTIGVMGSSAGGHLASSLMTHFDKGNKDAGDPIDRVSSRPDFGVLCYPVISFTAPYSHFGSRDALLGENAPTALVELMSSEKQVTDETPPGFLWSTADDPVVPVQNSLAFAAALAEHKVPCEVHVYPHGPHGLGLGGQPDSDKLLPWTTELVRWLRENGWIAAS